MLRVHNSVVLGPDVPIYSEWKTDWEVMMEKLEERCDNCVYALGNFESEDSRQTKWFDPKKADEKKKNMLVAVLGLEYFLYDKEVRLETVLTLCFFSPFLSILYQLVIMISCVRQPIPRYGFNIELFIFL